MTIPKQTADIINVRIEEGNAGLFYATAENLLGLVVGKPDVDSLLAAIPEAIADLYEAKHGTRPVVIPATRTDRMVYPWVVIPASAASRLEARAEITEAMAIRAFQVFDQHPGSAVEGMRAALEVVLKGETP